MVETEAVAEEGSTAAVAEDACPSPSASGRKSPVFDAIKMEWREKERWRVGSSSLSNPRECVDDRWEPPPEKGGDGWGMSRVVVKTAGWPARKGKTRAFSLYYLLR